MPEILEYSADPLSELGYRARPGRERVPRFGLEVETRNYCEDAHSHTYDVWESIRHRLDSRADGYCIAAEDGSICGDNPAELKTPPLTKWDHALFHATASGSLGAPLARHYSDMRGVWVNRQPGQRWFPDGVAWSARSCGMHITVAESMATTMTWNKMLVWLNCHKAVAERRAMVLFLRDSNNYCAVHTECYLGDYNIARSGTDFHNGRYIPGLDKYSVLHVKRGARLNEFRGFRSSLNPQTIMRNIEVVESLLLYLGDMPLHFLPKSGLHDYGRWLRHHEGKFPFLTQWIRKRASDSPLRQGFLQQPTQE